MEATTTQSQAAPPPRLRERYEQEVLPALIRRFGYTTPMQAPTLTKITLNMGLGEAKQNDKMLEAARSSWRRSPGSSRTCAARASRSPPSRCARGCRSGSR